MNELRDARPPADGAAVPSPPSGSGVERDALYTQIAEEFGAAIERLARAYEQDPDRRRDLLQEIHLAIWRSLALFDGRCSLRTWVYRVAHNTTTSQIVRRRTSAPKLVALDEIADVADGGDLARASDRRM
jgi:RNA polymerase sigma-70 factor, ECF subfamily